MYKHCAAQVPKAATVAALRAYLATEVDPCAPLQLFVTHSVTVRHGLACPRPRPRPHPHPFAVPRLRARARDCICNWVCSYGYAQLLPAPAPAVLARAQVTEVSGYSVASGGAALYATSFHLRPCRPPYRPC